MLTRSLCFSLALIWGCLVAVGSARADVVFPAPRECERDAECGKRQICERRPLCTGKAYHRGRRSYRAAFGPCDAGACAPSQECETRRWCTYSEKPRSRWRQWFDCTAAPGPAPRAPHGLLLLAAAVLAARRAAGKPR